MIKAAWPHGQVELPNGAFDFLQRQTKSPRQFWHSLCRDRREYRRHKAADGFRIDYRIRDLIGLLGDQTPPDGIALGPKIFALIVEAIAAFVDDDSQRHTIQPRNNTSIKLGRPAVDCHCVTLLWIADRFGTVIQKQLQNSAFVIRRAANDEVARGLTPHSFEPFQIRFETTGSHDNAFRAEFRGLSVEKHPPAFEPALADVQFLDLGVVENANAPFPCRRVVGIH